MEGREMRQISGREGEGEGEGEDMISQIPDDLKGVILSLLPTKDSVRTSVLSSRWKNIWRFTSALNFNQKSLLSRDELQSYLETTNFVQRLDLGMQRAKNGTVGQGWDPIGEAARWIENAIEGHKSPLTSCRIQHMVESKWEAEEWVKKLLLNKNVKKLSMERDPPVSSNWSNEDIIRVLRTSNFYVPFEILAGYEVLELINYHLHTSSPPPPAFEYRQNLKTIKLTRVTINTDVGTFFSNCLSLENVTLTKCHIRTKVKIHNPNVKVLNLEQVMNLSSIEVLAVNLEVLVLDIVECLPQSVVIAAPNLKVFHCYSTKIFNVGSEWGLQTHFVRRILKDLCAVVILEGSNYPSVYENLVSLYTNLNLRNEKDAVLLSFILKSCRNLQNLEIKNEVNERIDVLHDRETNESVLPYHPGVFWRMMAFCKCVNQKFKTVYIKGFKGKELEVEFVKYLITTSKDMEKITISFDNDCKWEDATAAMCLLSFPKNSANLSIILKPGKDCLESDGGSFQKWVSTLE